MGAQKPFFVPSLTLYPGPLLAPGLPLRRLAAPLKLAATPKLPKFLEVGCCLSLGLNPKRKRFGWLCRLGRRGVGEKC